MDASETVHHCSEIIFVLALAAKQSGYAKTFKWGHVSYINNLDFSTHIFCHEAFLSNLSEYVIVADCHLPCFGYEGKELGVNFHLAICSTIL